MADLMCDDFNFNIDEYGIDENEDSIESINCFEYYPGLRAVADKICINRLRCGLSCKDCKANESDFCVLPFYWRDTPHDTIRNDMVKYFGEDIVSKITDEVKQEYGESIFKVKYVNRDEEIIKEYLNGGRIINIAQKFNTNESEIHKIIKKHKFKYYSQRDAEIYNMYNDGVSIMKISKKYGLSVGAVYRVLRLQGLTRKSPINTKRNADIYRDYQLGLRRVDLAKKYDLSEQSISNILKTIKLELNKKDEQQ